MSESLFIAIVAVLGTIAGSVATGIFTLYAARRSKEFEKIKERLIICYEDIASFHRLEDRYLLALATSERKAESWKRNIRKQQANDGYPTPSKDATWRECARKIKQLR